jgi:hypothetical protein
MDLDVDKQVVVEQMVEAFNLKTRALCDFLQ